MFGFQSNVTVNNYSTGLVYKGTWDALLNVPTLTSGVGVAGEYYIVSIAGTTNLDGVTDWQVGDWAIFEGSTNAWQKVDNHDVQAYNTIQEEGTNLPQRSIIDFQGAGVTASDGVVKTIVTVPIQPAYSTIQDEGGALTQTNIIDFQGAGVTASNGIGKTIVTIPGTIPATTYGLFAQTADSTPVTATIVESSLIGTGVGTLTVPANGFSIGDSFTAFFDGRISCVGTATLHIKVKTLTGVLLADTGIIAMDAATNHNWKLDLYFTIRTLGTSGVASISSGGLFGYIKNSGNNYEGYVLSTLNTTTFDTTVNNTLVVTAQWNTTNVGNSIFSRNFTLTKVY
jgi:hypothetical protein